MEVNELSKNAKGGTELMLEALHSHVDADLLSNFQIIPSRVRELKEDKIRILWCHDLPDDPETHHLANGGWQKFHKLVFVSHWQQQAYMNKYQIPWSHTCVLHNAIEPLGPRFEKDNIVHIVYHTTPHRGLQILVPVFEKLAEEDEDIRLHVYSSFKIYGWPERDKAFEPLYEKIKLHEKMRYWGSVPHDELMKALPAYDIFAYPSIWPETSCISLMEAMSAGLLCVHSNFAALPETAANWTAMYPLHEDMNAHANIFAGALKFGIEEVRSGSESLKRKLESQKMYADLFYSWDLRKHEWASLLNSLKDLPRELPKVEKKFVYEVR